MAFTRKQLGIPYALFLLIFVVLPLLVVLYYAFTNGSGQFTLENFAQFFTNGKALGTLLYSFVIAIITTGLCLLIAYPTAYFLAKGRIPHGAAWLLIIVLPMWINFTLRLTAMKEILSFLEGNLAYHPFFNTIVGMTYDFLPFMVLPLYNTLEKMDHQLIDAARDLGASDAVVIWRVMIPLSMPGIVSGVTMVFLPAMTNYVVLDMMYNSTYIMGSLIGSYFAAYNWHDGSMISTVLLLLIGLLSWISKKAGADTEEGGAIL